MRRMSLSSDGSNLTDFADYSFNHVHYEGTYYTWETPTVAQIFVPDLYARMLESPESTSPDMLFGMFLVITAWPKMLDDSPHAGLDILLVAAVRGSIAARGVVDSVVRHYGATPQEEVQAHQSEWRGTAALSGSLLARRDLALQDPEVYPECMEQFQTRGGYATLYGSFDTTRGTSRTSPPTQRYSRLHWLATYGTPAAARAWLESEPGLDLNNITDEGETAIYLACARGSWEILQILLAH